MKLATFTALAVLFSASSAFAGAGAPVPAHPRVALHRENQALSLMTPNASNSGARLLPAKARCLLTRRDLMSSICKK
jgi:hypothetical protein